MELPSLSGQLHLELESRLQIYRNMSIITVRRVLLRLCHIPQRLGVRILAIGRILFRLRRIGQAHGMDRWIVGATLNIAVCVFAQLVLQEVGEEGFLQVLLFHKNGLVVKNTGFICFTEHSPWNERKINFRTMRHA